MRPSRWCSRCLFWTDVRVYGQGDKEPGGSLVSWLLGCSAARQVDAMTWSDMSDLRRGADIYKRAGAGFFFFFFF